MGTRCKHELVPLLEQPGDFAGRFFFLMCPAAAYLTCRLCGRVGWYTRYARRLSWLRPEAAERMKAEAERFREWDRARREDTPEVV
jgi:hypothetical protein